MPRPALRQAPVSLTVIFGPPSWWCQAERSGFTLFAERTNGDRWKHDPIARSITPQILGANVARLTKDLVSGHPCPKCNTGRSSYAHGGNALCFHCDSCGFIQCDPPDRMWQLEQEVDAMKAQLLTVTEEREAMQRRAEAAESDWRAAEAERDALRLRLDAARHDAFVAGYHCQWIRAESRYIFDSMLKPGDPEGAFAAWLALPEPKDDRRAANHVSGN